MISWLYLAIVVVFLLGGVSYLIIPSQLAIIIGVVNFLLLILVFLRVKQLLKWHERTFSVPQESKINEDTIKTLIKLESEKK